MSDLSNLRDTACAKLSNFIPLAGTDYARGRNFDTGQLTHPHVSQLSAYIRHRLLLETEVLEATINHHTQASAEKFIQEVFWRGYFKGWLQQRPEVWARYKSNLIKQIDRLERDAGLERRYSTAIAGETGIACFDHWARELTQTGHLHNHARMWFASIWIFTLKLPWELGADFFFRHLSDGDPASNTCSWRWVGGLHTKGKTYLARADNIAKFTNGRFSNTPGLATIAPPLEEAELAPRAPFDAQSTPVNGGRYGLVITEEDCLPESLNLPYAPTAILVFAQPTARSTLPTGQIAHDFTRAAIVQTAERASTHFGIEVEICAEDNWKITLDDWYARQGLDCIVTPYMPVGPVRTKFKRALKNSSQDISWQTVHRPYDVAVWPHAKAGFFGMKKKIPSILRALHLEQDLFSQ